MPPSQVADFFMRNHISKTLGPTGALIYTELRRCLSLRGGQIINGRKWIWKTVDDLAELFGISERTVRRHLKRIIDLGFLIRKKQKASQDWDQTYWYAWGDTDPFTEAKTCPLQGGHADRIQKVKPAGSSNGQERTNRIEGQAIPTADETATLLERIRQWPKATPPSETQKTQIVVESSFVWDPSGHGRKQHQAKATAPQGFGVRTSDPQPTSVADRARSHHPCSDPFRQAAGSVEPPVAKGGMIIQ